MRRVPRISALLLLLPLAAARAQDAPTLVLSAGVFDTAAWTGDKGDFEAIEAGVALHGTPRVWGVGPWGGIAANDDGAFWISLGVRRPFALRRCWHAGPAWAVAYYDRGDGKDLGHEIEFHTGLEIFCRGDSGRSLGIEFYHLSNAGLSDVNPGVNSLVVTYGIPLGR
ncbi:MAG: acyloxyacyl hydrolase [Acidobacteriota bacterium]|nr:acyloxyacyl hydrolase [Acidobacteriota bacterium]MDH3524609.1 acyloxyacyl hydrolase [Acidobacteriota bacterium]